MGFKHVSLSSEVMPMVKVVPRGFTTAADAYLTPVITRYIHSFKSGFDEVGVLIVLSDARARSDPTLAEKEISWSIKLFLKDNVSCDGM